MRRVGEVVVVLCVLAFVVTLHGCGGSGGPNGPSVDTAGKKPPPGDTSQYYVTELPKPAGSAGLNACAEAVSDAANGVVWAAGYCYETGFGSQPVVWEVGLPEDPSGQPTVTPKQLAEHGSLYDINQYGRAVGASTSPDAALYYDGSTLHYLQQDSSGYAHGIGTNSTTVRIAAHGASGALLWEFPVGSLPGPDDQIVLPDLSGLNSRNAHTISDCGGVVRIAGCLEEDPDRQNPDTEAAVLWTRVAAGGEFTPARIGPFECYPQEVNASGQVVGWCYGGTEDAWLWQNGTLTVLPWLRATKYKWNHNYARGINDDGVVVGWTNYEKDFAVLKGTAVCWQDGQVVDLNTLVTVTGGLRAAYDINNQGMIAAMGPGSDAKTHAYLLRPK